MDAMPLAGGFCDTSSQAQEAHVYPLTWVQCERCTLVQVREDVPDTELFTSYRYASSTVPGLVRHFERYAEHLMALVRTEKARVLEIGCNDGVLLERLPDSWERIGVDPSDVAGGRPSGGYELVHKPFTLALAEELAAAGPFELVTSSNTLAHVSDLRDVFQGVAHMLAADGIFVLEVHDLDATLADGQWDTIYHEHKVEWSVRSLQRCLADVGLEIVDIDRMPLHGGVLRVTSRRGAAGDLSTAAGGPGREAASLEKLRLSYEQRRQTGLYADLRELLDGGGALCAYGASGRANVWINQMPELEIAFVVDGSHLRQGTWLPRVNVPVVEPARLEQGSVSGCLITAWNYATDIRAQHPAYSGRWFQTFGPH